MINFEILTEKHFFFFKKTNKFFVKFVCNQTQSISYFLKNFGIWFYTFVVSPTNVNNFMIKFWYIHYMT